MHLCAYAQVCTKAWNADVATIEKLKLLDLGEVPAYLAPSVPQACPECHPISTILASKPHPCPLPCRVPACIYMRTTN